MENQYIYNTFPEQQLNNQEQVLITYQTGTNPLDPLGLQGTNYTIVDPKYQNVNKVQTNQYITQPTHLNTVYQTQVQQQPLYLEQNKAYTQQIKNDQLNQHHHHHHKTSNTNPLYQYQTGNNIQLNTTGVYNNQVLAYQIPNGQIDQNNKNIQQNQLIYVQNNIQPQNKNAQINVQTAAQHHQHHQHHQNPQIQNVYQQYQQQQQPQIQTNKHQYQNYNPQIPQIQQIPQIPQVQVQQQQPQIQAKQNIQNIQNIQLQQQYQNQKQIQNMQNIQKMPYTQIPQVQNVQHAQQKLPQYQQKIQQNIPQQVQPLQQPQQPPQYQQKTPYQVLPKQPINQNLNQNQNQQQPQTKVLPQNQNLNQIQYQQYIQNIKNNNPNDIKIEYNKNDEHFVNKPIYQDKKTVPVPNPAPHQQPQIKTPTTPQIINNGNNNNNIGVNQNLNVIETKKKSGTEKIMEKYGDTNLSKITEEEIDIRQSGFSKISKLNSNEIVQETPIEEKKPETALPDNIVDEISQKDITEKSITESGISDYEANMSHLPTINSIMKGISEPLPPSKKNKYGK